MGFFDTARRVISGKSEKELAYERAAEAQIRRKAMAAEMKEREIQNVRLARERVRINTARKLEALKGNKKPGVAGFLVNQAKPSGSLNVDFNSKKKYRVI